MSFRLEVLGLGGFYDGRLHDAAFVSVYRGQWNTDGCTWVGGYYILFRITHCRRVPKKHYTSKVLLSQSTCLNLLGDILWDFHLRGVLLYIDLIDPTYCKP